MKGISEKTVVTYFIMLFICLLFLPTAGAVDNETARYQFAAGKLVCDANPCITDPCLPGMIMFIKRLNGNLQPLTIDGSLLWDCVFEWKRSTFEDGDDVLLIGQEFGAELEIICIYALPPNTSNH